MVLVGLVQLVAERYPGRGEGLAELSDRLGTDSVQPGEVGLPGVGKLVQGGVSGRGEGPNRPGFTVCDGR